jgi:hypothetical protein
VLVVFLAVIRFLEELSVQLDPLVAQERAELLALKQAECEQRGIPYEARILPQDFQVRIHRDAFFGLCWLLYLLLFFLFYCFSSTT